MLSGITDEDKFDTISGIGPAIAVQQSIIRQSNPRSTVGSRTNILNMLGVLYSGEGRISCLSCGTPVDDNLTCGKCGNTEERFPATYFSYNSPNGMCMKCSGRGSYFEINMKKLVPDNSTTLAQVFDTVKATPGYANLLYKKYKDYIKIPFWQIPDHKMKSFLLDDVFGKNVTGWIKDPDGNTTGGWGLVITPRDMARFGFLYLNRGVWDNTQIISDSWIDKSTALNSNKYGYLWWLREENGTFTFAALGSGGNLICCIPEKDMVVTIASKIVSKPRDRWLLIKKCILPAIIE